MLVIIIILILILAAVAVRVAGSPDAGRFASGLGSVLAGGSALMLIAAIIWWARSSSMPIRAPEVVAFSRDTGATSVRLEKRAMIDEPVAVVPLASPWPAAVPHPADIVEQVAPGAEPAVWTNVDPAFVANAYPNVAAAVRPLAQKVRVTLEAVRLVRESDDNRKLVEPRQLWVTARGLSGNERQAILKQFTAQLRTEFSTSEAIVFDGNDMVTPNESEVAGQTVVLTLSLDEKSLASAPWDRNSQYRTGHINCDVRTPEGTTNVTSAYIEKPWVEAFDVFVSERPNRHLVVGYSGRMVSSEQEARRLALRDAQQKYWLAVDGRVVVIPNESYVVDRFAQKLSRPYGDVWREAVLLDVSADRLTPAIAAAHQRTAKENQRRHSAVAGLLIVFAVTIVLCVTLNLLTQGYYRGRLLIGTAAVVGLIVLAVVA